MFSPDVENSVEATMETKEKDKYNDKEEDSKLTKTSMTVMRKKSRIIFEDGQDNEKTHSRNTGLDQEGNIFAQNAIRNKTARVIGKNKPKVLAFSSDRKQEMSTPRRREKELNSGVKARVLRNSVNLTKIISNFDLSDK